MRVLFVCLGNICRSPLAEGLFREVLRECGAEDRYECASRGTSAWHAGGPADPRTIQNAMKHGVSLTGHCASQLTIEDCERFDCLVAMDRSNLRNMTALAPHCAEKMHLLREFDLEDTDRDVPDPYYEPLDGFETVYQIVRRCVRALYDFLEEERTHD